MNLSSRPWSRHGAAAAWVLLMLVTPYPTGQTGAGSFLSKLATVPELLEALLTLTAALLVGQEIRRNPREFLQALRRSPLAALAAYYALGLLAAAFAELRVPAIAYAGQGLIGVGLSLVVFEGTSPGTIRAGSGILYVASALACAGAVAVWLVSPQVAWAEYEQGQMRLGGIGLHPNQLGFLAAVLGLGGIHYWLTHNGSGARLLSAGMLLLGTPVLLASRGRVDLLGFGLGAAILLALARRWIWIAAGSAALMGGLILLPGLWLRAVAFANRGLQLPNLAGRLAAWQYLIERAFASPKGWLLGEGVGTSSLALRGVLDNWPNPGHSHNLLVEALHSLGLPGVALVTLALIAIGRGVFSTALQRCHGGRHRAADLLAIFLLLLGASAFEHTLAGRANVYAFVGWALAGIVSVARPGRTMDLKESEAPGAWHADQAPASPP